MFGEKVKEHSLNTVHLSNFFNSMTNNSGLTGKPRIPQHWANFDPTSMILKNLGTHNIGLIMTLWLQFEVLK